jgi:hypothetical protein
MVDKEVAIAEAKRRLLPLFIDIQSWNEPNPKNAKRERQHAAALLRYTLDKDKDAPLSRKRRAKMPLQSLIAKVQDGADEATNSTRAGTKQSPKQ